MKTTIIGKFDFQEKHASAQVKYQLDRAPKSNQTTLSVIVLIATISVIILLFFTAASQISAKIV